jgi:DNA gyrase subunit A
MARDWPARDVAPLVALIDDPRHMIAEDGTDRGCRTSRPRPSSICGCKADRARPRRDRRRSSTSSRSRSPTISTSCARARACRRSSSDELNAIKSEFATPRRTVISIRRRDEDEDLIQREDMVVTVSHAGYVKRVPLSTYRAQRAAARAAPACRPARRISSPACSSPRRTRRCCSSRRAAGLQGKGLAAAAGAPQARGKALINHLPLEQGERITTIMPLPEDETEWEALDVDVRHHARHVRRNKLSDFARSIATARSP